MREALRKRRSTSTLMSALLSRSSWLTSKRSVHPHESTSTWQCGSDISAEADHHHHHHYMDVSLGAFARAVTYLNVSSRKLSSSSSTTFDSSDDSLPLPSSACRRRPPFNEIRLEDIFYSQLNKCDADALPVLRQQRAEVAPILCYESDSETASACSTSIVYDSTMTLHSNDDVVGDKALHSRMEALLLQQQLLGCDHPDVHFLASHIRQHRRRQSSVATTSSSNADYSAP